MTLVYWWELDECNLPLSRLALTNQPKQRPIRAVRKPQDDRWSPLPYYLCRLVTCQNRAQSRRMTVGRRVLSSRASLNVDPNMYFDAHHPRIPRETPISAPEVFGLYLNGLPVLRFNQVSSHGAGNVADYLLLTWVRTSFCDTLPLNPLLRDPLMRCVGLFCDDHRCACSTLSWTGKCGLD